MSFIRSLVVVTVVVVTIVVPALLATGAYRMRELLP